MAQLIVAFRNFVKTPKNFLLSHTEYIFCSSNSLVPHFVPLNDNPHYNEFIQMYNEL